MSNKYIVVFFADEIINMTSIIIYSSNVSRKLQTTKKHKAKHLRWVFDSSVCVCEWESLENVFVMEFWSFWSFV